MIINILTLFPKMFEGFVGESIIKRAIENGLLKINVINIRDYAEGKHKQCDDMPFGGGAGMVLKPEPIFRALEILDKNCVIYTTPQGKKFDQEDAKKFAKMEEITIIAGHYEGVDERVVEKLVTHEVSLGDFVLTGGELAAMVISDAVSRLIPGVLGNSSSYENDSFYNGVLDHPHYTRPAEFMGMKVPDVLMSGHHKNIEKWRRKESLRRTIERRPELIKTVELTKEDKKLLKEIENEK